MADTKFSDFPNGTFILDTDTLVGLRAGANVKFNPTEVLLSAKNLSDVSSSSTSLSNIGGQPITIIGSGDPNGNQAGTAGISLYFDTAAVQLWICTQTGSAVTAVWAIQNQQGGGIDTINLNLVTPVQLLSNKLYIGILSSPSPAIGIMPIAPTAGDLLIIYSAATQGVIIQKGTASVINVTNNLVTTSLFVPFRNTLVLRCSNPASGGQWFSESIDDTVIIDSTTTVGYQPLNIVGSGDPNGNKAGVQGVNFYFDTSTSQIWICTQTGDSSTAVWTIQNESGMETINLNLITPIQMFTNKLYIGTISSPSPAIGIMPVSPNAGDVIIIYAAATQGVTIQKGTAALINITNNLVVASLFIPFRNTVVLRCFSAASGGQWFSESIDDTVIIDGTTTVGYQPLNIVGTGNPNGSQAGIQGVNFYFDTVSSNLWQCKTTGNSSTAVWQMIVNQNTSLYPQIAYINSVTGDNSSLTGSLTRPFLTYDAAVTYLLTLSPSDTNRCAIYATGVFNTVNMNLYPFIDILPLGEAIFNISGTLQNDTSWDSTTSPIILVGEVKFVASSISVNFSSYNGAFQHYRGTDFSGSTAFNSTASLTTSPEKLLFTDCLDNQGVISYNMNGIEFEIRSCQLNKVISTNASTYTINPTCIDLNSSTGLELSVDDAGTITNMYVTSCRPTVIDVKSSSIRFYIDSSSYMVTPIFSGGAGISNIYITSLSDGEVANTNFTPVNYTPTGAATYKSNSTTANLKGIDDELGIILSPPILAASNHGLSDIVLTAGSTTFLAFKTTEIDTASAYNNTTCAYTIPKNGIYEISYQIRTTATGGVATNSYFFDTAVYVDGLLNTSDEYSSNRRSDLALGVIVQTTNSGGVIMNLNQNQVIKVNSVNNGNMSVTIFDANICIKYLSP